MKFCTGAIALQLRMDQIKALQINVDGKGLVILCKFHCRLCSCASVNYYTYLLIVSDWSSWTFVSSIFVRNTIIIKIREKLFCLQ